MLPAGAMRWQRTIPTFFILAAACAPPVSGPSPAPGGVPGFDTWQYPGDDVMRAWREASPYRWVGYYLLAPCRRDGSWVGKRAVLEQQGWGIAVLYVGQQAFEGQEVSEITETTVCSRALLTADQGRRDAQDAIAKTQQEGFPAGTVIFLDVERMDRISAEMVAYYQAWITAVLNDGRFVPGTYAHRDNAGALYLRAQEAAMRAGRGDAGPFWVAGGRASR